MNNIESLKEKFNIAYPEYEPLMKEVDILTSMFVYPAGNTGKEIVINHYMIDAFSEQEQMFFLARELMHIEFDHVNRGKGKNITIWNKAADAVVTAMLKKDGFVPPESILPVVDSDTCDTEELYNKLISIEIKKKEKVEVDEDEPSEDDTSAKKKPDDKQDEGQSQVVEYEFRQMSDVIRKETLDKIEIVRSGKGTTGQAKAIHDIGVAQKLHGLADMLEASVNVDYDWFPGDSIKNGMLRYEMRGYPIPQAEILIDTSMSVDEALLKAFIRYCKALLKDAIIKVGCFDTRFYGFTEVRTENDIDKIHFQGFGGTDFTVAVNAFTGDAENKIIFTDGYAEIPEQRCDVIWVVYGSHELKPKGGRVLYITDIIKNTTGGNLNEFFAT